MTPVGVSILQAAARRQHLIDGSQLVRWSQAIDQTIDGVVMAFAADAGEPWIVIRAVDSSCFDVITANVAMIGALRDRFDDVAEIDGAML